MNERITAVTETAHSLGRLAREPLKDAVKEAMHELDEEPARTAAVDEAATTDDDADRLLRGSSLLATGVVIGFLIASRRSGPTQPIDRIREKSPLGVDDSSGEPPRDTAGATEAEAVPRPDADEEGTEQARSE